MQTKGILNVLSYEWKRMERIPAKRMKAGKEYLYRTSSNVLVLVKLLSDVKYDLKISRIIRFEKAVTIAKVGDSLRARILDSKDQIHLEDNLSVVEVADGLTNAMASTVYILNETENSIKALFKSDVKFGSVHYADDLLRSLGSALCDAKNHWNAVCVLEEWYYCDKF